MTSQHPITPPPELVQEWCKETTIQVLATDPDSIQLIATKAAQWGADQEMEACKQEILDMDWFAVPHFRLDQLQAARRPQPEPTLKELALAAYARLERGELACLSDIRRALEQLND